MQPDKWLRYGGPVQTHGLQLKIPLQCDLRVHEFRYRGSRGGKWLSGKGRARREDVPGIGSCIRCDRGSGAEDEIPRRKDLSE